MFSLSAVAIASSLLFSPVKADFDIFIGTLTYLTEGGLHHADLMRLYSNPPDCDDYAINHFNSLNDASSSGWACDDCEEYIVDAKFTRLELPHSIEFNEDVGHLTLYLDESNGGYGLYNQDMEQFGICERPKDPQHLYCVLLMDEIDTYHAAECYTDLTLAKSN